jgi:phosphoserine phosphatase
MNLVLQGAALAGGEVATIAALTEAQGIHALADPLCQAFRLTRVRPHAGVEERCARAGIDWALVPPEYTIDRVRVVAIDMDSTLITIECIDEIADMAGIRLDVAAITASAMRGEIDFRESLERRVALLAGLPVAEL